jgi:hypothetical protein
MTEQKDLSNNPFAALLTGDVPVSYQNTKEGYSNFIKAVKRQRNLGLSLESQRDYHKSVIFLEFQFIEEQLKKNKQKTSPLWR